MMKLFKRNRKSTKKVNTMSHKNEVKKILEETKKQYHKDTMTMLYIPNYKY